MLTMLQAHSLLILHILQVPRVLGCINRVCCVHYYIPFCAAPLYFFSTHTTAMMMTTRTISTTAMTLTVPTTSTSDDCWGVSAVGGTEVVATVVIVVVTVGAIVVVTVGVIVVVSVGVIVVITADVDVAGNCYIKRKSCNTNNNYVTLS